MVSRHSVSISREDVCMIIIFLKIEGASLH